MTYQSTVLADSPIRYYRLGDSSGTVATDTSTSAQNGTISGGVTLGTAGLLVGDANTAMTFDNSSSGAISVPTTSMPTGASAWSMECWLNMPTFPTLGNGFHCLMGFGTGNSNEFQGLYYINSGGKTQFALIDWNNVGIFTTNSFASTSTTYYIVGTSNGTTQTLYVNNSSIGTHTATLAITLGVANIGTDPANEYAGGVLDEVAWYSTALSSTQISNHYTAGTTASHLRMFNGYGGVFS